MIKPEPGFSVRWSSRNWGFQGNLIVNQHSKLFFCFYENSIDREENSFCFNVTGCGFKISLIWHKTSSMRHFARIEFNNNGLLFKLANHYTMRDAQLCTQVDVKVPKANVKKIFKISLKLFQLFIIYAINEIVERHWKFLRKIQNLKNWISWI